MKHHSLFYCLAALLSLLLASGCLPAKPLPTRPGSPTVEPTSPPPPVAGTPAKVTMWCDLWLSLDGPAGDLATRNPSFSFEARVQGANAAQVVVQSPSGEKYILPPYSDIPYGGEQRFVGGGNGLPVAGRPYTCTALAADGAPIPGAAASDIYIGGKEPDPPTHVRAVVVAGGLQITWAPSPVIPGAFDPAGSPPVGYYVIFLYNAKGEPLYSWLGGPTPPTAPSHLIPLHQQDFTPGDAGLALEALGDGTYRVDVNARSVTPDATPQVVTARTDECISKDSAQDIRLVIEKGQARVGTP